MTGQAAAPGRDHPAAWRRARAQAARQHHPDLGGDIGRYLAALAEVDARFSPGAPAPSAGRVRVPPEWCLASRAGSAATSGALTLRRLCGALARRMRPGPRYIDL